MSKLWVAVSAHPSLLVGALGTSLLLGAGWSCRADGAPAASGPAAAVAEVPIALPVHPELVTGQLRNGFSYFLRPVANTGKSLMLALALLRVQFDCKPEDVEALRAATLGVITELESGASESHLEIVRAQRNKQVNVALQSDEFWVSELGQALVNRRDPRKLLEQPGLTARITRERLREAARRHLSPQHYVDAVWSAQ